VIDEQFKAEVKLQLEELVRLLKGTEGNPETGLIHKVDRLTAAWEGGKAAASIVRWLAAIAVGCAGAFAWLHNKVSLR